jgi:hypothetical protein|nr:MAG TPA: Rho termination factor, N-terminal domain [Caudoviricetes sp.]
MLVKIISGTYGQNVNGLIKAVRVGQTAEVTKEEADRLVELGVAELAEIPDNIEDIPEGIKTPDGMLVGHLDADFLNEMPFDQLKKLGSDMGIPVGKLKSRENIVNAIVEQECYVSAEEDAPDLSTEDPIV